MASAHQGILSANRSGRGTARRLGGVATLACAVMAAAMLPVSTASARPDNCPNYDQYACTFVTSLGGIVDGGWHKLPAAIAYHALMTPGTSTGQVDAILDPVDEPGSPAYNRTPCHTYVGDMGHLTLVHEPPPCERYLGVDASHEAPPQDFDGTLGAPEATETDGPILDGAHMLLVRGFASGAGRTRWLIPNSSGGGCREGT